jgi:uncharacterized protein (DUF2235 family)
MAQQLVICLDGTNNQVNADETNILRIYRMLNPDPTIVRSFYAAGVGTFGLREALFEWQKVPAKVMGLAFGWGLRRSVEEAYRFISEHYEENCEIYIFGFSRGAYTARVVAAMIHAIGLLPPHQLNLFDYAWAALQDRDATGTPNYELHKRFKTGFARPSKVNVRFLGLFDTVKSVGWIYEPLVLPYTFNNPSVEVVRHAISIDERRAFFRSNLWSEAPNANSKNIKQVWFPGVHSDVGGGYPESESSLAKCALQWMVSEAVTQGLNISTDRYQQIASPQSGVGPSATDVLHDSLEGAWWIAEFVPRIYRKKEKEQYKMRLSFPLLQWHHVRKHRYIDDKSLFHKSVIDRLKANNDYRPPNLPFRFDENGQPEYDQWGTCADIMVTNKALDKSSSST